MAPSIRLSWRFLLAAWRMSFSESVCEQVLSVWLEPAQVETNKGKVLTPDMIDKHL